MLRRARSTLAALVLASLSACTFFRGDDRVLVTSTPPGAAILVDGNDVGQTTPSMVELGGIAGSDHAITVRKRGFMDETRQVLHYTTAYTSNWWQGALDPGLWRLPLWWTLGDIVMPFGVRWRYVPHEVHVKLYREGEGPVTAAPGDATFTAPAPAESAAR
jgi:hypothetical protein